MPYVPSEKTKNPSGIVKDGKAQDRILIDRDVKALSGVMANYINTNNDIAKQLFWSFKVIGKYLQGKRFSNAGIAEEKLAETIKQVGDAYKYEGAFLGELNYAITRLIQEVPKRLVEKEKQKSELRYFIYALTVEALVRAANYFNNKEEMIGIGGVFTDIKDEYKRRVNPAYEAAQIVKSGDCYDTPYLTKLIEVVDQNGDVIGHQEVMIKREDDNGLDVFGGIKIQIYSEGLREEK